MANTADEILFFNFVVTKKICENQKGRKVEVYVSLIQFSWLTLFL